jgi:hypothetical protein
MQQLPIENATATKQPGRPKLTRQEAAEKHAEWYRLHLMGWTPSEIAQAYLVNKSSVHRAIDAVRHAQSWGDRNAKQRHADLLSEIYDGARLTIRESWRIYLQQLKEKPASAFPFLRAVQSGLLVLSRLAPDQELLYTEELAAKVGADQRMIEKWFEEKNMQSKILPVRNGS